MKLIPLVLAALMASGCTQLALAAQAIQKLEHNAKERERLQQEQKQIEHRIGMIAGDSHIAKPSPAPTASPR